MLASNFHLAHLLLLFQMYLHHSVRNRDLHYFFRIPVHGFITPHRHKPAVVADPVAKNVIPVSPHAVIPYLQRRNRAQRFHRRNFNFPGEAWRPNGAESLNSLQCLQALSVATHVNTRRSFSSTCTWVMHIFCHGYSLAQETITALHLFAPSWLYAEKFGKFR